MAMTCDNDVMAAVAVAAATAGAAPAGCGGCTLRQPAQEAGAQDVAAHDVAVRRRCVDRRAAARAAAEAVGALLGVAPEAVSLLHRPDAAPVVRVSDTLAQSTSACAVSVAHSRGRAVAAAVRSDVSHRRIGIDLERAGTVGQVELRLFATSAEIAAGVEPTTLWALKEAAWKALGCGGDTPFRSLELGFRDGVVCSVSLNGAMFGAAARVWAPWRGWVATLVSVATVPCAAEVAA